MGSTVLIYCTFDSFKTRTNYKRIMGMKIFAKISLFLAFSSFANAEICNPCRHKEEIATENAPAAIGPYSQAILAGNLLFVSGQIGLTPYGVMVDGTAADQSRQALTNIENILKEASLDFSHIVKSSVLLKDINDYDEVNAVYAEFFPDPAPARAAFQVAALPKDALVEIEVIAQAN